MPRAARLRLEGATAADALMAGYDADRHDWRFPRSGEFWETVAEAHRRGLTGRGRRAAVIDTAFDLDVPRLAAAAGGAVRQAARAGEPTAHGTAVALLILTAAPDAELDLYEVTVRGRPDPRAVRAALDRVSASDAAVACLSLGMPVPFEEVLTETPIPLSPAAEDPLGFLQDLRANAGAQTLRPKACPLPAACLCRPAERAAGGGRIVVAAAGNDAACTACPAIAEGVVAVGFKRVRRAPGSEGGETAELTEPSYSQTPHMDLSLMQPEDVLGSSFAAPLAAGAALLGLDAEALPGMVRAARLGGTATSLLQVDHGEPGLHRVAAQEMLALFATAVNAFPHLAALEGSDHWCVGCSLFGRSLFINAGLAFHLRGSADVAERLLRIGRRIAPEDPHAAANLATTLLRKAKALGEEALTLYDEAIARRPGERLYDEARAWAAATVARPKLGR
ncbi:S8 family serine peptidase [Roseomonas sp. CCTCC AB2023176]|uniref:S8 family serine peptidase n=1 Tax=Roseomonas sp. CCTCC AB2023176 TaxID=3342640 RepID=UPI0035D57CB9